MFAKYEQEILEKSAGKMEECKQDLKRLEDYSIYDVGTTSVYDYYERARKYFAWLGLDYKPLDEFIKNKVKDIIAEFKQELDKLGFPITIEQEDSYLFYEIYLEESLIGKLDIHNGRLHLFQPKIKELKEDTEFEFRYKYINSDNIEEYITKIEQLISENNEKLKEKLIETKDNYEEKICHFLFAKEYKMEINEINKSYKYVNDVYKKNMEILQKIKEDNYESMIKDKLFKTVKEQFPNLKINYNY